MTTTKTTRKPSQTAIDRAIAIVKDNVSNAGFYYDIKYKWYDEVTTLDITVNAKNEHECIILHRFDLRDMADALGMTLTYITQQGMALKLTFM